MRLIKALKRIKKECKKHVDCKYCKLFLKNEGCCFIEASPSCWHIKQLKKERG